MYCLRKITLTISTLLLAGSFPLSAKAFEFQVEGTKNALFEGVAYEKRVQKEPSPMVVHILTLDLTQPNLRFAVTNKDASKGMEHVAHTTSDFLTISGASIAINASYFLPFAGGSKGADDYYPKTGDPVNVSGAELSHGEIVSPVETDLDIRVNAIVCFKINQTLIREGQVCPTDFTDAVAAGPLLLEDGVAQSFEKFDNNYAITRAPRTAIGLSKDAKTAWLVVVDGRQTGYSEGANLIELTQLFLDLGADEAINLDGGGSSTMVMRDENGTPKVLNSPIHTGIPGRERPVANHIVVFTRNRH